MHIGQQQAARGVQNASARTLPFMDEAHRGAQPSDCPDREHLTIHCLSPSTQSGLGSPGLFDDRGRRATMAGRRPPVQEPSSQSGNLPSHPARYLVARPCTQYRPPLEGWLSQSSFLRSTVCY